MHLFRIVGHKDPVLEVILICLMERNLSIMKYFGKIKNIGNKQQ